ncbi:SPOR domain-containing protein [Sphingomonas sp. FW199]|uniref:SPOR domain-containing protein n=1 Tax=Sphingomonas sp. FW199 TaxID=3400217 RepID=UPI003CE971B0
MSGGELPVHWLMGGMAMLAVAGSAAAQDQGPPPAPADAPQGVSGSGDAPARIDDVGYAIVATTASGTASISHPVLPAGSVAEVTSIDTGKTVLLTVVSGGSAASFELSTNAAAALGITLGGRAPVRIRPVNAAGQEIAVLRAGSAPQRLDAPPALLAGLRKRLPVSSAAAAAVAPVTAAKPATSPPKPEPKPKPAPQLAVAKPAAPVPSSAPAPLAKPKPVMAPKPATGTYFVQVAVLSARDRADKLAESIGGQVSPVGTLFRVRTGPFADRAAADKSRASVVARGFPDARVVESR